jgi:elongation factor Ts
MSIDAKTVKELRDRTGAGMMECKKALTETSGDIEAAIKMLRESGVTKAAKRAGRSASEGGVVSYIHQGSKMGSLVEINCETDFVARTDDFINFCKEIAMHVAAMNPKVVDRSQADEAELAAEKEIFVTQAAATGKPDNVIEKIVTGKVDKYLAEISLLEQPFVKDTSKTIKDLLTAVIAKVGENIVIKRFARFSVGE